MVVVVVLVVVVVVLTCDVTVVFVGVVDVALLQPATILASNTTIRIMDKNLNSLFFIQR